MSTKRNPQITKFTDSDTIRRHNNANNLAARLAALGGSMELHRVSDHEGQINNCVDRDNSPRHHKQKKKVKPAL